MPYNLNGMTEGEALTELQDDADSGIRTGVCRDDDCEGELWPIEVRE